LWLASKRVGITIAHRQALRRTAFDQHCDDLTQPLPKPENSTLANACEFGFSSKAAHAPPASARNNLIVEHDALAHAKIGLLPERDALVPCNNELIAARDALVEANANLPATAKIGSPSAS
jgi:hypothetical protein